MHDGQKTEFKARLVAQGFLEKYKPKSDLPTMAEESLKLFIALAAKEGLELTSMDLRAAILQAKMLDREVYMTPPKDQVINRYVKRLRKPLY